MIHENYVKGCKAEDGGQIDESVYVGGGGGGLKSAVVAVLEI